MVKHGRLEISWPILFPGRDGLFAIVGGFNLKLYPFQLRLKELARDRII